MRTPTNAISCRAGRFLELQCLLARDAENEWLAVDDIDDDPMSSVLGHSITYRIAVGPNAGRKVMTLQNLTRQRAFVPPIRKELQVGS